MMDKKRWLWKRKSSDKSPGETESSGSVSSHSERYSDEQEALMESPSRSNQSPDVTSKATVCAEDVVNNSSFTNEQLPEEVTSKTVPTTGIASDDGSSEKDENVENENIKDAKEGDLSDGIRNMSEKLSAALVNVNAKEDLVKQHAKVAEEAIAGWEKAENEVAILKKQLDTVILRNSVLEDRVNHLDGALKECVRQLRQTREEQEENIYDAVAKKTQELESAKIKLENKLSELQNKLGASEARSSIDINMCQKVECLEKENMALRHEILVQSEELEIRTIERDLSTQAAETASKQHLESIKKVAKLEAECRRLRSMASRASVANDHKSIVQSSFSAESITDNHSDSAERLTAVENDAHKMSGSEPIKCEPSCSDSWASALIAELDQFKNEKCRQTPSSSVKIDLMDDFLEMERLVALPENKNESSVQESVVTNQCTNKESSLREEFEIMNQKMDELKEKLENVEADKAELEIALMRREGFIQESQLQLREAAEKLEELQRELENAYKSKQRVEDHLVDMVTEVQTLSVKVDFLEDEVDKERDVSSEIAMKCRNLEEELERKSAKVDMLEAELDKNRDVSEEIVMKFNELEKELEIKSTKVGLLEAEISRERDVSSEIAMKCRNLEEELERKSAKVDMLEAELDKKRDVSEEIVMKINELEKELEIKSTKVGLLETEISRERDVSSEIAMKCRNLEEELERKSAKVDILEAEVDKKMDVSDEIVMKFKDLEKELEIKSTKVGLLEAEISRERDVSDKIAKKCKELEEDLENKSAKVGLLGAEVDKERDVSDNIAKRCKDLEEELENKSAKVGLLEAEVAKERGASENFAKKCKVLEEELESKSAKVDLLEAEVDKRVVSDEISLKCKDLEEKLERKSALVDLLQEEIHKERATSEEIAMKCRELEEELLRSTASSYGEKKIKQEDLALAAGKLAECQKTIASLGNQLKSLATLEDFLIDTASIPASPPLIGPACGEMWKFHSNGTFSPKRDSTSSRLTDVGSSSPSLNKDEETSLLSSATSPALQNHVSSERSRNGFAKFFSRTKSGIRLEI